MKDLIKMIDELPFAAKVILCIPVFDLVWATYRIMKGIERKDNLILIVGIVWLIGGAATWIFDLITTILYRYPKLT